jgi:hypothetical protein
VSESTHGLLIVMLEHPQAFSFALPSSENVGFVITTLQPLQQGIRLNL